MIKEKLLFYRHVLKSYANPNEKFNFSYCKLFTYSYKQKLQPCIKVFFYNPIAIKMHLEEKGVLYKPVSIPMLLEIKFFPHTEHY